MTFPIVDSSPQAKTEQQTPSRLEYPFDSLEVGKSFVVPLSAVTESQIRMAVSRRNKKEQGKFKVIKHGEPNNCYEVARVS
ncbi:hypothetical protein Pfeifenkraut_BL30060 [Xanthomonas phage Pfeifenkraut]|uniref:Uncharacterized protein n=1 Tax=Xanthomonas phage Pfeifenkraut TaxID=2939132 RepID=A0A9E7J581_9CAUD|nr:hypothetical protein QAY91_gp60 [Xanthomonas phage Pfeifenkraut]URA06957.1 hypothetical protein Pfeifenkraut_BL30060 [Xanthomonas phage Pfeifenkraut]